MQLDAFQGNDLAGLVFTESLVRNGVSDVVLSPGSRSTPLAYACASDPRLHTSVVLDERSAGFFALGRAKSRGLPVVLLCTSGTASAQYLPAVVEARYSQTPLLVITTDRPLVGQHCHSGQTILQTAVYADFCNHRQMLELPRAEESYLRYLRETLREAVWKAQHPQAGVVHLNFPFEEPLTPLMASAERAAVRNQLASAYFAEVSSSMQSRVTMAGVEWQCHARSCMWILGSGIRWKQASAYADVLQTLAELHIPVCIDGLHPARSLLDSGATGITSFEGINHVPVEGLDGMKPDLVFQWGNLPTSKALRQWLGSLDCARIVVQENGESDHRDPGFLRTVARMDPQSALQYCQKWTAGMSQQKDLFRRWSHLDEAVWKQIHAHCRGESWSESVLCHKLPTLLQHPCDLFVGNSMIVRDVELFYRGSAHVRSVLSNRGANGIDGLVSTAMGAIRKGVPLLCLIGDLSFFHDAGGLNLASQLQGGCCIVFLLLDNHGGGIFEHLPIAGHGDVFETYFATPQNVKVKPLCEAYGIAYASITSWSELHNALGEALDPEQPLPSVTCFHLRFDRKSSRSFRKSTFSALQLELQNLEPSV